jgi:hypothetical protein
VTGKTAALRFLALGISLFALERALVPTGPAAPERIVVAEERLAAEHRAFLAARRRLPDAAETAALAERLADEERLFREALARGHHRSDGLVRRRLARNLRFLTSTEATDAATPRDQAALHREALALGLHRSDRVVRQRLIQKLELELAGAARAQEPSEAELAAHHAATAERWHAPARVRLEHVFLSRARRGPRLADAAAALLARLRAGEPGDEVGRGHGDPLPLPPAASWSEDDLARYLGAAFAAQVLALPEGSWSGPLESSQGVHLVRVTERSEGRSLPLAPVRSAVREDLLARRAASARRALLATLRKRYPLTAANDAEPPR